MVVEMLGVQMVVVEILGVQMVVMINRYHTGLLWVPSGGTDFWIFLIIKMAFSSVPFFKFFFDVFLVFGFFDVLGFL